MRAAAGRTGVTAEIDRGSALFGEHLAPVAAQDSGQSLELVLLDQEVRLGPSTLGAAGTSDDRRDPDRETAVPQALHVLDRAGHRRDERETGKELLGVRDGQRLFHTLCVADLGQRSFSESQIDSSIVSTLPWLAIGDSAS
jgi:hypothetical protein